MELGRDQEQFERYCDAFEEPVRRGLGHEERRRGPEPSGDRRISVRIAEPRTTESVNAEHLLKSIDVGLGLYSSSPGRADVSDEVWENSRLVRGLRKRLGCRLVPTTRKVSTGCLKADTTDTPNNRGVSLRVNSPVAKGETVGVMNVTGGQPDVGFPSMEWLRKYLPDHLAEIGGLRVCAGRPETGHQQL